MNGANRGIRVFNLRRINKNTLIGTADIEVPAWGVTFRNVLWHRKGQQEWVSFPSREWADRKTGEIKYANLVELTRPVRERFQHAALEGLHQLAEAKP